MKLLDTQKLAAQSTPMASKMAHLPSKPARWGHLTKSPSSNQARQSARPSLCRATQRREALNQVSTEQPSKTEVTIQYKPTHVSMTRHVVTKPRPDMHVTCQYNAEKSLSARRYTPVYGLRHIPTALWGQSTTTMGDSALESLKWLVYWEGQDNVPYRAYAYAH
jgi:hypothetical protein